MRLRLMRSLGFGAAAGAGAGLAGGLGARLVMRVINVVDGIGPGGGPSPPVFTAMGTFEVVLIGVLAGAARGLPFSVAARTIRGGPLVAGLAYAFVLFALLAPTFFLETGEFAGSTFRIGLFMTLFPLYGVSLGVSYAWLGPRMPTSIAVICAATALPGAFLVATFVAASIPDLVLRYNWGALLFGVPWAVLALVLGAIYAPGRRRTEAT